MKKIKIFTAHDISNAYSCLIYLKESLENNKNIEVEIWAGTDVSKNSSKIGTDFHCLKPGKIGKMKLIGGILSRFIVLINSLFSDMIIINELEYFKVAYIIKKIFPSKIIVHYNTEMYGDEEGMPCRKGIMSFYEKHASFPDVIIECLPERAEYRKEKYKIAKTIFVINNTIPKVDYKELNGDTWKDYIRFDNDLPILIYAGGCNMSRGLQAIIDVIDLFDNRLNFLLFCYGSEDDVNKVKDKCSKQKNCLVYNSVERKILFEVMQHCDIGIQYYNPELSINNKFAAPSKFFEYMAMGLNILSTNNVGINKIINDNKIGVCFDNDTQISSSLNCMLEKGLKNRDEIIGLFEIKFNYEKESKNTIKYLLKLIKER